MSDPTPPANGPGQPPPGNAGPPGGYQPYPSSGPQGPGTDAKGFFGTLFDFSFSSFVTPKIVKLVYVLATIAIAIGYLGFLVAAFDQSAASGFFVLIFGAIGAIVYLAFIRMTLEFYFAIVRMSEDINHRLPSR